MQLALELFKFITAHPEHMTTLTKLVAVLHDDPTFVTDITKFISDRKA